MRSLVVIFLLLSPTFRADCYELHWSDLEIEIRRTEHGVPHIKAKTLRGVAFGLAYCEMEDYGKDVVEPLIRSRGELALLKGYEGVESDFINKFAYERVLETYHLQEEDTRQMLEGFAAGVNYFLEEHRETYNEYVGWQFTGYDVAAVTTTVFTPASGRSVVRELLRKKQVRDSLANARGEGSNAWAFGPERTVSGKAVLFRNPHLNWDAGYYEAHLMVEGRLNFYGDFRIGGLFAIVCGFNDRLGWSTTNNDPDLDEVYALPADPDKSDHYILDGVSMPVSRKQLTVSFKNGHAQGMETREFLFTAFGPVILRQDGQIWILKRAGDGEYRRGDQFLQMMQSRSLAEWKSAMRLQAVTQSNFTYADADGNIYYVWNALTPDFPIPSGGDSMAVPIKSIGEIWHRYIAYDSLPQLLNPKGGYLHNENDPFHFTNLNEILLPEKFPASFPRPMLRQRSQHSLSLIHNTEKFSLEQIIALKHSMKMVLADQVKQDLLMAIQSNKPGKEMQQVALLLRKWDNTASAESRAGVLFEQWWSLYSKAMKGKELYRVPWNAEQPMATPRGLADSKVAFSTLQAAVEEVKKKYGHWDVPWGEINRLRQGEVDLPASGCPGNLGCFRVLWFEDTPDGKRRIRGGDGWQLVVEFSDPPKAYSVLAYGQSNNPKSEYHSSQAALFAGSGMKPVAFKESDIEAYTIKRLVITEK